MTPVLVDAWLPRAAARHPDRPAINRLTYAQLLGEAARAARKLAGRGVGAGDRVGIELPPGEAFCVALHACLLLGAVAVPIDVRLGVEERLEVARGAAFVVAGPVDGDEADVRLKRWHDLDAVAIVVHTSGSSGRAEAGRADLRQLAVERARVVRRRSAWTPGALALRAAAVARRRAVDRPAQRDHRDDRDRPRALRHRAGRSTSSAARGRRDDGLARADDARSACSTPGCATPPRAALGAARRRARRAGAASGARPRTRVPVAHDLRADRGVLAGRRPSARRCSAPACGSREDGEILVSGPTVAPGAGPVLATGDLGAWNADGVLHVVGRKSDTIVTGGENVAPAEVEAVLEGAPGGRRGRGARRAASREWGEAVVAHRRRARRRLRGRSCAPHCAARLASFKVPKAIRFADALPRTRSGKLERGRL